MRGWLLLISSLLALETAAASSPLAPLQPLQPKEALLHKRHSIVGPTGEVEAPLSRDWLDPLQANLSAEEEDFEENAPLRQGHAAMAVDGFGRLAEIREGMRHVIKCADDGANCSCSGVAVRGEDGPSRTYKRVEGIVVCEDSAFGGTPQLGAECLCYSLGWCSGREGVIDPVHRRRSVTGRVGRGMHQRRRWCGFGPRDCTWGDWGKWSTTCSGTCGTGHFVRHRLQDEADANGGHCEAAPKEMRTCKHAKPCPKRKKKVQQWWLRRRTARRRGAASRRRRGRRSSSRSCFKRGIHTPNMPGTNFTKEVSPQGCQVRCLKTVGCAHFSFWPGKNCSLQDANATFTPVVGHRTGPRRCPPVVRGRIRRRRTGGARRRSAARRRRRTRIRRRRSVAKVNACFKRGSYHPLMAGKGPTNVSSAVLCQQRCAQVPGCAHFTFGPAGSCTLQDNSSEFSGTIATTAGPRSCGSARAVAPPVKACFKRGSYAPMMAGKSATKVSSAGLCQWRCAQVPGCAHFTFGPNGHCTLQDKSANFTATNTSTAGPLSCGKASRRPLGRLRRRRSTIRRRRRRPRPKVKGARRRRGAKGKAKGARRRRGAKGKAKGVRRRRGAKGKAEEKKLKVEACFKAGFHFPDMAGENVTEEVSAKHCHMRCARVPNCTHFSYQDEKKRCSLQDSAAKLGRDPKGVKYTTGPRKCPKVPMVKDVRRRQRRKPRRRRRSKSAAEKRVGPQGCYRLGYHYPWMEGQISTKEASARRCQIRCETVEGCVHFSYWQVTRKCYLQDKNAQYRPRSNGSHVETGPAKCGGQAPSVLPASSMPPPNSVNPASIPPPRSSAPGAPATPGAPARPPSKRRRQRKKVHRHRKRKPQGAAKKSGPGEKPLKGNATKKHEGGAKTKSRSRRGRRKKPHKGGARRSRKGGGRRRRGGARRRRGRNKRAKRSRRPTRTTTPPSLAAMTVPGEKDVEEVQVMPLASNARRLMRRESR